MRKIKYLTLEQVEQIAFRLAKELMEWDETIPDFTTRFPNRLESCLVSPSQTFSSKSLYPGFTQKASILFYLLIKNHPFQNGNKRIAVTCLFVFLELNNKWLRVSPKKLYNFAIFIAESDPEYISGILVVVNNFIKKHIVPSTSSDKP